MAYSRIHDMELNAPVVGPTLFRPVGVQRTLFSKPLALHSGRIDPFVDQVVEYRCRTIIRELQDCSHPRLESLYALQFESQCRGSP